MGNSSTSKFMIPILTKSEFIKDFVKENAESDGWYKDMADICRRIILNKYAGIDKKIFNLKYKIDRKLDEEGQNSSEISDLQKFTGINALDIMTEMVKKILLKSFKKKSSNNIIHRIINSIHDNIYNNIIEEIKNHIANRAKNAFNNGFMKVIKSACNEEQ